MAKQRVKRDIYDLPALNDPKWPRMWYLNRGAGLDMNVLPAWQKGYTGKGIVVSILDDGLEKDHPDLKKNFNSNGSYDVNDRDPDPQPRYDYSNENRHGTRCAGEVAAESNNSICSTGIAYDAGIGGVRMLDGDVTDAVEAQSLSLNPNHVHIYSASWGPDDNGKTVDGPGPLTWKAFQDGIAKGRNGLGSIFVWASGNGGQHGDNCNCDGYTNSIYTLSISSATENGQVPWYSEPCPSTLGTTYSSGSGGERQIVTTDLRKGCTETHTGTSASAPLAAGICAIVLQANLRLTWRDLQHIVVLTAKQANLEANDWTTNAVGRKVSHHFGFGLMDVGAMVALAENWTTVPEQHRCEITSKQASRGMVVVDGRIEVPLESNGCLDTPSEVRFIEHVQATISLSASRRGDIEIFLVSPGGTRSTLLGRRPRDMSPEGFNNWAFMTTHCWGERASGLWRLEVRNSANIFFHAKLTRWTLVVYGTNREPHNIPSVMKPWSNSKGSAHNHLPTISKIVYTELPPDASKSWPVVGRNGVRSNTDDRDAESNSASQSMAAMHASPKFTHCLTSVSFIVTVSMTLLKFWIT